ncbi:hypothetical protein Pla100_13300 [Neorhodopirellula pilleata]|uniref:Uncharacterized protein n=1 Tax=Neorhodopirellula pilleata TaxID=2714738 RepID=A0A5C6ANQ1_9BACT|nr:hypothetical protein Pla100_13300 [Neorhodopirellula pilleata]
MPLWAATASIGFCCVLPWVPIGSTYPDPTPTNRIRFGVRTLLIATTFIAVAIPLLATFPLATSGMICAAALIHSIIFAVKNSPHRLATVGLLACMLLPFSWVVHYEEFDRILPAIPSLFASMPTLVPGALIGHLVGQSIHDSPWIAQLLTAVELLAGAGIIRLGPKRTIAYLLLVMQVSLLGSLAFYQLCVF